MCSGARGLRLHPQGRGTQVQGNGGLGRLAPAFSIRSQPSTIRLTVRPTASSISDSSTAPRSRSRTAGWLRYGNPWEIARPNHRFVSSSTAGSSRCRRAGPAPPPVVATKDVFATPYDTPIPGYRTDTVNTLRLWARALTNMDEFNSGGPSGRSSRVPDPRRLRYLSERQLLRRAKAASRRSSSSSLRRFRTSSAATRSGGSYTTESGDSASSTVSPRRPRSAERHRAENFGSSSTSKDSTGTTPGRSRLGWAATRTTLSCQKHSSAGREPALRASSRHLQIVYDGLGLVHRRWDPMTRGAGECLCSSTTAATAYAWRTSPPAAERGGGATHGDSQERGLSGFPRAFWPERIGNKTNGITPRRWAVEEQPGAFGPDHRGARQLVGHSTCPGSPTRAACGRPCLRRLVAGGRACARIPCSPRLRAPSTTGAGSICASILTPFSTSRSSEISASYKRQLLNVLHVITLYNRLRDGVPAQLVPRTVFLRGKARLPRRQADQIRLIKRGVGEVVNNDPAVAVC